MIDTRPHDRDTTLMGPGFFVFFQRGIIETGGYEPVYKYHPWVYIPEEKKALEIVEQIVEQVVETQPEPKKVLKTERHEMAPKEELELILRLRLQVQDITFELKYLELLLAQIQFHRQQEEIFLLLLH